MIFFYIRHGDPIYNPDSLTPFGHRQAEALAKRLSSYGIDRIYSSTSNRAIETAKPTAEMVKKEIELLDFCNECYAWRDFTVIRDGQKIWISDDKMTRELFASDEITSLGHNWYEHSEMTRYKEPSQRIYQEISEFFKSLGYEQIKNTGKYIVHKENNERVALFAHSGFARNFISTVLGIPYPMYSLHFDMCTSGMTVIEFEEENGYSVPKILTFSSDSHIYREGLPTKYNNRLFF